jgi:hypothetical protein
MHMAISLSFSSASCDSAGSKFQFLRLLGRSLEWQELHARFATRFNSQPSAA